PCPGSRTRTERTRASCARGWPTAGIVATGRSLSSTSGCSKATRMLSSPCSVSPTRPTRPRRRTRPRSRCPPPSRRSPSAPPLPPTRAPRRSELDLAGGEGATHLRELRRPGDAVVVLAALTPDKGRGLVPFMANLAMAAGVCIALEKVDTSHVVYFSSDSVYGAATGRLTEASCAEPNDLYGTMHLAREVMIRASARGPVAVLR